MFTATYGWICTELKMIGQMLSYLLLFGLVWTLPFAESGKVSASESSG